jgi:hypothetical protein
MLWEGSPLDVVAQDFTHQGIFINPQLAGSCHFAPVVVVQCADDSLLFDGFEETFYTILLLPGLMNAIPDSRR